MTLPCRFPHRTALLLLAVVVALVLTAVPVAPAQAHTDLVGSSPEDGSQVQAPPEIISLHFNDGVDPRLATVVVTVDGGDAARLNVGPGASERSLAAAVPPSVSASGRWRVDYRVTSLDGHPVQGGIRFDVAKTSGSRGSGQERSPDADPATSSPSTGGDAAEADEAGTIGYVAGTVLLLALSVPALLVVLRRPRVSGKRRRSAKGSG